MIEYTFLFVGIIIVIFCILEIRNFINAKKFRTPNNLYEKKCLNQFTDEELYEILQKNEITSLDVLAAVSSEVLRRMIQRQRNE